MDAARPGARCLLEGFLRGQPGGLLVWEGLRNAEEAWSGHSWDTCAGEPGVRCALGVRCACSGPVQAGG